ncbi:hypothetical protein MBLNU457_5766t1 [Dothideomycetes sp. NU457]
MGRYNFAPQRVHQAATRLLETKRLREPPPWYDIIGSMPPSERLTRPALQRNVNKSKKTSRMFQPIKIEYPEDKLREEFFGDHPWELARPRVVLEDDGKDFHKHDWSRIQQPGKPLDGESVVQRQRWLMANESLSKAEAYDKARKEFYDLRHTEDIERRVAKEEAMYVGAVFAKGPLEIGMELEDKAWDHWREWAKKEVEASRQMAATAYTGLENEDAMPLLEDTDTLAAMDDLDDTVPAQGQDAFGGAIIHP